MHTKASERTGVKMNDELRFSLHDADLKRMAVGLRQWIRFGDVDDGASPILHRRVDTAAIALGRLEQWMLERVRLRGTMGFVVSLTLVIVLASVGLTVLGIGLVFGFTDEALAPAMLLGAAIPMVVAPPTLYVTVRLAARLDTAGKSLRLAALTDPLTGVLNRRGFFEAADDLAPVGRRVDVAMVDVDQFKTINDEHGHATGDLVLKMVADWLVGVAGEDGVVSRMGGDEFALIVASSAGLPLPDRQVLVLEGITFSITIGSAAFTSNEDFEHALAQADTALYRLKRA